MTTSHLPADRTRTRTDEALAALGDALGGRLVLPSDPGWDQARAGWNLSIDQQPSAVVEATGVADVQATVRAARAAGLRVAPQATGHGSEALSSLDGAILLKTAGLTGVSVDPAAFSARLGAGVLAADVADAAAPHGLAPVLGLAPPVGGPGLSLGGGTGWRRRAHGLAANNVLAFEVVLPSGEARRVDAGTEPDLFWALRGGGGRFGIVTAIEVGLHAIPEVSGGMLAWPAEQARDVLEQFRRWTRDAPESLGAVFRYLSLPPIDAIPEPLRGRRIVSVAAVHAGSARDGARLLEPLRGAAATLLDTFGPIGLADLPRVAGDPEQPMPSAGEGVLIGDLTVGAAATLGELIATDAVAPLTVLEVRLLGGALSRRPRGHGALAALDGGYSVFAGGAAPDRDAGLAVDAALRGLRRRLVPWIAPQALLTSSRTGTDAAAGFDGETWQRLEAIRDAYDPDRIIQGSLDAPAALR
ncbi:MAG: hypothetical protein QOF26_1064 [Baekduia sp.]|nr:hypothetical protein [Baekduia sp.]